MNRVIEVGVANWDTALTDDEIDRGVRALQVQLDRDFSPHWGVTARVRALRPVEPTPGLFGLALHAGTSASAGARFEATSAGLPQAEVFLGDLPPGRQWTHPASRELLQLLVDPVVSRAVYRADDDGTHAHRLYAHEICAPCSGYDHGYDVDGWRVSDFVHPAWFGGHSSRGTFDHLGRIDRAWGVLDGARVFAYDLATRGWLAIGAGGSSPWTPPPGTRLDRLATALARDIARVNPYEDDGIWGGP
jgi:hypothetical protein